MVRKEVFGEVDYFDERFFMYGEDVDLCRRITQAGWKLYYMSEAEIIHVAGAASRKASSHFPVLMKCESISKFIEKYHGRTAAVAYRGVVLIGSCVRLTLLFAWTALSRLKMPRSQADSGVSRSKYVAMLKWSIGLQKPLIKEVR